MKNNKKHILNILVLVFITILVLYFSLKDDFQTTLNLIINSNKWWVLVGLLLMISYWFFRTISIYSITKKFKKDYSFKKAFKMVITTQFFHAITPFSTGGQPYEMYCMKKEKISMSNVTNITIQNFIVYQIALVFLGIIAFIANLYCNLFPNAVILKKLVLLGFIINTLVIVGLFALTFCKKIHNFIFKFIINLLYKLKIVKDKTQVMNKMQEGLEDFNKGAKKLLTEKKHFFGMILINLMALIILYSIPVIVLFSMGDYHSFTTSTAIVTSAYVMLIGSFVPIPGGSGGLEYGFVQFYGNFVGGSKLNAMMILWRFLTYYLGMIVGAITLSFSGKKDKK